MRTDEFCKEAAKRRINLGDEHLQGLWRAGLLAPFVEVRNERRHPPYKPSIPDPKFICNSGLCQARNEGRLIDAEELGFRPQLRFERKRPKASWWNGLLYSRWQLLGLERLRSLLVKGKSTPKRDADGRLVGWSWRCGPLSPQAVESAFEWRRISTLLVALEARYLPLIDTPLLTVSADSVEEWDSYRQSFDAAMVIAQLGYTSNDLVRYANRLLGGMDGIEVLDDSWSELVRRSPRRSRASIVGDELVALDRRDAAEILLLCYEDLASKGQAPSLEAGKDGLHWGRERLSYRSQSLDGNLSSLGISPHPGVVLVVEGETEEVLVTLVRDHMRIPTDADVVQTVVLRGVTRDLTKLAAFASAPLVEKAERDHWLLVKPPTYLVVAVDPDDPYNTPEGVEVERQKIVEEIIAVVRAQGVDPERSAIESLIRVTTWQDSCFEFAHFDNDELAAALLTVHRQHGGLDAGRLAAALDHHRRKSQDIKHVWENWWPPEPSKRALARALWPKLQVKLDSTASQPAETWPPIARVLHDAFIEASQIPRGRFVLKGTDLRT